MNNPEPITDAEVERLEAAILRHPPMPNTRDALILALIARLRRAEARVKELEARP